MASGADPNNPYAFNNSSGPPVAAVLESPPAVKFWALVYNVFMVILYLLVAGVGLVLLLFADEINSLDDGEDISVAIGGVLYAGLGFLLAAIFAVGIVWRRGNGAWIYQTILIAIGLTSCITWPATIPLLIYWIRDRQRLMEV